MELTALQKAVLAKAFEPSASEKKSIPVGRETVEIEITARVIASTLRSEDTEYTPTAKLGQKDVLALMGAMAGAVGPAALKKLEDRLVERVLSGKSVLSLDDENPEVAARVQKFVERVEASLAKLPKEVRAGALRVDKPSFEITSVRELDD